jgi:DNA invertase Pin-like site-specific DNA recombinase
MNTGGATGAKVPTPPHARAHARRAALYLRISDDRAGDAAGVTRQHEDCLAYCERSGFDVVEVYGDNDISASAYTRKQRPSYRRMLAAARAGELDVIVAWHLDRLYRRPRELEDLVDLIEARGGGLEVHTLSGDFDLTTADGRAMARVLVAMAAKASDDSSRRIRRKALELAERGQPTGGGTRPFGYEADRRTVREPEAAHVREAARRLLAGETIRGILREWTAAGVPTVTGGPWRVTSLRRVMVSPRIAGLREHNGTVIGPASWPPIITAEEHEALRAILLDPGRRMNHTTARSYLLTGFAVCGLCGARLIARPNGRGARAMVCATGEAGGCGKIRRVAGPLEDHVRDRVLAALDGPALAAALRARAGDDRRAQRIMEAIRADEARLERTVSLAVEGAITAAELRRLRAEIDGRLDDHRRALARLAVGAVELPRGDLAEWWGAASLDRRRAVLGLLVEEVRVLPAVRGRTRFDPSRVEIAWRQ